jgi:hypothetical protein
MAAIDDRPVVRLVAHWGLRDSRPRSGAKEFRHPRRTDRTRARTFALNPALTSADSDSLSAVATLLHWVNGTLLGR